MEGEEEKEEEEEVAKEPAAASVRNTTGRPTDSTNLDPQDSQRLNHQQKSIQGLDLDLPPHTYGADVQFGLHVGPKQLEKGLFLNLLPVCGLCSTSWAAFWPQWKRKCLVSQKCQSWEDTWREEGGTRRGAVSGT